MSEEEFERGVWTACKALPNTLRRYTDPDRPLPQGSRYIESAGASLLYILFAGFWWLVATGLAVAMLNELSGRLLGPSPAEPGLPPLILVGLLLCAIFGVYNLTRTIAEQRGVRKERLEGRFREGLFLLDDGLLLKKQDHALFLPKDAVTRFERITRGRGDGSFIQVHYDVETGERGLLSLERMDLDSVAFELEKRLDAWLQEGSRPTEA
ncbi:MAG: hypothetical protein AAGK22_25355 [Acidobacteriota bacterium]